MMILRRIAAFAPLAALCISLAIGSPEAASPAGSTAELAAIKAELEAGRKKLKELAAKEGTEAEQLEQISRDLSSSQAYLKDLEGSIAAAARDHQLLADSLARAQGSLAGRQAAMQRRVRAMYKAGSPDLMELFVTARGLNDVLRRLQYFRELSRYDRLQLDAVMRARNEVSRRALLVARKEQSLLGLRSEKEQEQEALESEQSQQAGILAGIRAEKQTFLARVKQLEQAQREMNALLKKLKAKEAHAASQSAVKKKTPITVVKPKTGFDKRRGTLAWPLSGPILKRYGKVVHPVYQTVTMNSGIDIGAPRGTPVTCSAAGTVEYVGTMRGYGTFIIVNHGDGFRTIYAHLARVAVKQDQRCAIGAVLASVGDGNSPDEKPALHFQVRHESETLDPLNWLSAH